MKRKGLTISVLLLLAVAAGLFYAYQNLGAIVQTILEKELPGLKFEALDVGLNRVSVSGVEYAPKGNKARLSTKNISISPSLMSLLGDTFEVADIIIDQPVVVVRKRSGRGGLDLPVPEIEPKSRQQTERKDGQKATVKKDKTPSRAIHIGKVRINKGSGEFIDESVAGKPARFNIADVDLSVDDLHIPSHPGLMPLDLKLSVPAQRPGKVSLSGAVDRTNRTGDLNLNISSFFLPMLAPYYRDPQMTLRMADGQLSADADISMQEGKYKITGYVQLADLKIEGGQFYGIGAAKLQEYFKKNPEPIKVDLAIEGHLDKPGSMRRSVMQSIVKSLLKRFGGARLEGAKQRLREGDVEGAKQELKSLKRELKDLFKRR